jgi:hypothetical protein
VAAGDGSTQRHRYGPAPLRVIPPPPAPSRPRRTPPPVVFSTYPGARYEDDAPTTLTEGARRNYTASALTLNKSKMEVRPHGEGSPEREVPL